MRLQHETWGANFGEAVPASILQVAQKVGGIAGGAFDGAELVGFVFGISGVQNGELVHWSDMLAVRATHQNHGIGERLKWYQRAVLLVRGIKRVLWSFDPLQTKNAHLNFKRLGITAREYVIDMYGQTKSPLHAAGTDRLIATWDLLSDRVVRLAEGEAPEPPPAHQRIEIPAIITDVPEQRALTRALFTRSLPEYVVTGFERGEKSGCYVLTLAADFSI